MRLRLDCPTIPTAIHGEISMVDGVVVDSADSGCISIYLVNRSATDSVDMTIDVGRLGLKRLAASESIHETDPHARNTDEEPLRVMPRAHEGVEFDGQRLRLTMPPTTWAVATLAR